MTIQTQAQLTMQKRSRDFSYRGVPVLATEAKYPYVGLYNSGVQGRINAQLRRQLAEFFSHAAALYKQAILEYQESLKNNFPFRPFTAMLVYEAPYNANCYLSLYRDRYDYTGGAHGITVRFSDTYSLITGRAQPLSAFFAPGTNVSATLLPLLIEQAQKDMQTTPGIYFDNYPALIEQNFKPEHYYLSPKGLVIYYQQYDIGPYVSGIITFTLPYDVIGWHPVCP